MQSGKSSLMSWPDVKLIPQTNFISFKGPLSSNPEEHQLRSGLWPVPLSGQQHRNQSRVFLGALVLEGFSPFGVSLVFLVGVGDQVLSEYLSGDGVDLLGLIPATRSVWSASFTGVASGGSSQRWFPVTGLVTGVEVAPGSLLR